MIIMCRQEFGLLRGIKMHKYVLIYVYLVNAKKWYRISARNDITFRDICKRIEKVLRQNCEGIVVEYMHQQIIDPNIPLNELKCESGRHFLVF